MGQLTNQYVSQSYQGLLKMTDSTTGVTATLQTVQTGDGTDTPLQISKTEVNISGSLTVNGSPVSFNTGSLVTTASFNAYTSSNDSKVNSLIAATGSYATTSSLTSLSQSIAVTDLGQNNVIAGLATTSSVDALTGSINSLNAATSSFVTETESGSFLITGSANGNTLTFTKGNGATFNLQVDTGSNSNRNGLITTGSVGGSQSITGSLTTTGSNTFIGAQIIEGNVTFPSNSFVSTDNVSGSLYLSSLNQGTLYLNADGGEGDVIVGYSAWQNNLKVKGGTTEITGSLGVTNIKGTGSLYLQPNQTDARYLEVYNTSPTDTHITASGGQIFLGDDQTYVKVDNYGSVERIDVVAGNELVVSSSIVNLTGSLHQSGTFYPDVIDWIDSSIVQSTGSYILTTNISGVTEYDSYQNVASALQPYLSTGSIPSGTVSGSAQIVELGFATTSSVNEKLDTGSFNSYTASMDARTGSYATTGSNVFNGNQTISGSLFVTGSITALSASFTYLETIYQTSSIIFSSGSNILGDEAGDTQTLNGVVNIPLGNLNVTGATTSSLGFFGNLQGTASYASNANSSSYSNNSTSSSYASNANSASFAQTAISSSQSDNAVSASQAQNAVSSSYSNNSTSSSYSNNSTSSSYASNATSASFATNALSASQADNANLLDGKDSTEFATTGSNTFTGTQTILNDVTINSSNPVGTFVSMISTGQTSFNMDSPLTQFQTNGNLVFANTLAGTGSSNINFNLSNGGDLNVSTDRFNITNPIATGNISIAVESGSFTKTAINLSAEKSFIQAEGDLYFFNTWDANSSGSINFNSPNQINLLATSSVLISGSNNVTIRSSNVNVTGSINVSGSANFVGPVALNLLNAGNFKQNLTILGGINQFTSSTLLNNYLNAITTSLDNDDNNFVMATNALNSGASGIAIITGSVFISGSNNLLLNLGSQVPASQGRKQIFGSVNIANTAPTINTSSLTIPQINNNYNAGGLTLTLTTGSNAGNGAHNFSSNINNGSIAWNHPSASIGTGNSSNVVSNINSGVVTSTTTGPTILTTSATLNNNIISNNGLGLNHMSSSIQFTQNIVGGAGFTINNRYYTTGSNNFLAASANILGGQGIVVNVGGSPATNTSRTLVGNIIGGQTVNVSLEGTGIDTAGLRNSLIYGQGLNVTGSHSATSTNQNNTTILGRWNGEDNGLADSARTVFAVGTGTNTSNRRTSLYVTSGSLVGVSGSLQVIGNTTMSGSLGVSGSLGITGSVGIIGDTTMSSSLGNDALVIDGTFRSKRATFSGNPFNNNGSGTFGSLNFESNNYTLQYVNNDISNAATQSAVYLTTNTGSNYTEVSNQASYAGVTTTAKVANYNGSRQFIVDADSTTITGSLAVTGNVMFASGSNKTMGTFVLDGGNPGVATVSNSLVSATSLIFLTKQTNANSGNGTVSVTSKGTGTFNVTSDHNGDADTVAYLIINPS